MNKDEIRRRVRASKAVLGESEKLAAAERVFSTVAGMAAFVMARNVLLYHSLPDELSTRAFIENMADCGKRFFLPRVNGLDLEILPYDKSRMHLGAFCIEEPDGDDTVDISQIDLPRSVTSGLVQALRVLRDVDGIGRVEFGRADIVRHRLVQRIVEAYDSWDRDERLKAHHDPETE